MKQDVEGMLKVKVARKFSSWDASSGTISRLIMMRWSVVGGRKNDQMSLLSMHPPKKPLLFFDAVIGHKLMLFSLLFYYFLLFFLEFRLVREGKIALNTHTPTLTHLPSLSRSLVINVHANFPHNVYASMCVCVEKDLGAYVRGSSIEPFDSQGQKNTRMFMGGHAA